MKQKLNRLIKKLNNSMFDVAAAPMYIMLFGMPALLGLGIGLLVWLAVRTVVKISRRKKQEDDNL